MLAACEKGVVEIVKLLIGAGADVNKADHVLLHDLPSISVTSETVVSESSSLSGM